MSDVTRITEFSGFGNEQELSAESAMIQFARDIMAGQARDGAPNVDLTGDGKITLRYPHDQGTITYITGVDSGISIRKV